MTAPRMENRKPLLESTMRLLSREAQAAGAYVVHVMGRRGLDEALVYHGGGVRGSVFRPENGGLAVMRERRVSVRHWRVTIVAVSDSKEAIREALAVEDWKPPVAPRR